MFNVLSMALNALIVLTCLFLICLILIQRGKGGGLAGAFGGVGGSSAFGTKSGDVFTKVTMVVASIWICLSMISVVLYNQGGQSAWGNDTNTSVSKEVAPKKTSKGKDAAKLPATAEPSKPASDVPAPATSPSSTSPVGVPAIPEIPAPAAKK